MAKDYVGYDRHKGAKGHRERIETLEVKQAVFEKRYIEHRDWDT